MEVRDIGGSVEVVRWWRYFERYLRCLMRVCKRLMECSKKVVFDVVVDNIKKGRNIDSRVNLIYRYLPSKFPR